MTVTTLPEPRLDVYREQAHMSRTMNALDGAVGDTSLDPGLRELVKLRASQTNGARTASTCTPRTRGGAASPRSACTA
jgi:alkylhydroperoxidase family enzyme